ncbi:MAG: haloalkane dehalogenase, partial [Deltaproteobacteria bacterium]|nr:haloalkane dehalogenase [Deltaproteobacteria bacterium]
MSESVSPDFPYESHWTNVLGSRMHFVEAGQGAPIVLVHGNPTSSYLWRNVIPALSGLGRVIAPDLIGFGKSDKPSIPYRVFDHAEYLTAFIGGLGLHRPALVLHDWGGFLGLAYAARHPQNVRALAMLEAVVAPLRMADRSEGFQRAFALLRGPGGREKVVQENFFVERILPGSVMRKLGEAEMKVYRAPFLDPASRLPTWVFPNDLPLDGHPADVDAALRAHGETVGRAGFPLLLLTFSPGAVIGPAEVALLR